MTTPVLYIDLASPYAYLAAERAESVLGRRPRFEPVVLGAIFRFRGHGSWAHTGARAEGMAEVGRRAAAYGLPPITWLPDWPLNSLRANRAVLWAERHDATAELALALFRAQFAEGRNITEPQVVRATAERAGLDAEEMEQAIAEPALKEELKRRTQVAWDAGVQGVPTLRVGEELRFGDDRLDDAAALLL